MAESAKFETLVYCLGQIGGEHNPVITSGSAFDSKHEYTAKGYARYIQEANNIMKFMTYVINYFVESVKPEFEEDPLAFIDLESDEDLRASIQKMKKQWKEMFKEHQKKLREALRNQSLEESTTTPTESNEESSSSIKPADEDSSESSSSSSAKMPRLSSGTSEKTTETRSESTYETTTEYTESYSRTLTKSSSVGVPVENLKFPQSIFLERLKDFGRVLKAEYQELRARMGKVLDRISSHYTAHDLKGFTFQKMEKFAKWKFAIKTLNHLVPELESKFDDLDLDFNKRKKNETRLTDWMYFDDGKRDRKYHHRLLITMELTVSIEEISAIIWKQMRRYRKLKQSLEKLPEEYEALKAKEEQWKYEVLYNRPMKTPVKIQTSNKSDDTYFGVEDMPVDA